MTGKPITTEVNPDTPAGSDSAGILSDLRASSGSDPALGDLGPLSARPKRRVSVQTLVLALVLTASAASLYTMRKQGMGAGMRFKTPAMAPEIDKVKGQSTMAEQRILAELAKSSLPAQGETEPLQKNPFVLDAPAGDTIGPVTPVRDTNAERLAAIREKLGNIRVNSVMDGPHPIARINDRLVSVGDIVDDVFLVAQIHDRSVDFIADGRTYTLNMGEAALNSPGKRSPRGPQLPMQPPMSSPRR